MSILINSTTLGNIIITLGSVFLLYYLIRKFAWDQITGIFAAREKKIATDIDSAENARQEAESLAQKRQDELAGARTEAAQIIDGAKETGKTQESKIIAEAHDEAKRLKEKAKKDIEAQHEKAMQATQAEIAKLAVVAARKILETGDSRDADSSK